MWIPALEGTHGSETAMEEAKKSGAKNNIMHVALSKGDIKSTIITRMKEEWTLT